MQTKVKPLSQKQISDMTKWLRDLDRATVNRNKQAILYLYEKNSEENSFRWDAAPEELAEEYDIFVDRANTVIGY